MVYEFVDFIRIKKGGILKRSLGMVVLVSTIPKAFGFEAATQLLKNNPYIRINRP
jgi:hypothetical protein